MQSIFFLLEWCVDINFLYFVHRLDTQTLEKARCWIGSAVLVSWQKIDFLQLWTQPPGAWRYSFDLLRFYWINYVLVHICTLELPALINSSWSLFDLWGNCLTIGYSMSLLTWIRPFFQWAGYLTWIPFRLLSWCSPSSSLLYVGCWCFDSYRTGRNVFSQTLWDSYKSYLHSLYVPSTLLKRVELVRIPNVFFSLWRFLPETGCSF